MKFKIEHLKYQEQAIKETLVAVKSGKSAIALQMETGTGKTFTFISSIFEIYKEQGFAKFIIVVPRVAIKEGVNKTFETFEDYFNNKYNNPIYSIHNYESGKMSAINDFINGNDLQILLLTKQSFDKKTNILNDGGRDELFGNGSKIQQIQELKPVVIIDEPQLNKDFNQNQISELLNPSIILSYSATQPEQNKENIVFQYTPEQAYNDRQVKRLEYFAVSVNGENAYAISLEGVDTQKQTAKIKYNGKKFTIKKGDVLGVKIENKQLEEGFKIQFIFASDIQFFNGKTLSDLIAKSVNEEIILREQIRQTILQHKQKQERLFQNNIKEISLFFVPTVSDFINENNDGIVKVMFYEEYEKIYNTKPNGKYAYYFSETAKVKGNNDNKEKEMTKLILKEKEQLLSLANPVEFIFAHTSLGVGWDNPNIFNICFLRNIASNDSKKQFVGRGLRLCVNQSGERIFESKNNFPNELERLNNLTIIGNLQYEQFCSQYQKEAGWEGKNSNISNANEKPQPTQIKIKNDKKALANEIWQKLKAKTQWYVNFKNIERFYEDCYTAINAEVFEQLSLQITGGDIKGNYGKYDMQEIQTEWNESDAIFKIKEKTWLSVNEIKNKILNNIDIQKAKKNPSVFIEKAIEIINNKRKEYIMSVAEIVYTKTGETFDDEHFISEEKLSYHENLVKAEKSLFNFVDCDSKQEEKFVNLAENTPSIEMFVKLPKGSEDKFHINTPIGKYTPDFALLVNSNGKLYMVFEVKSTKPQELNPEERFKIACAVKHFEQLGFDVKPEYIEHKGSDLLEISKFQKDSYTVYIPNNKS